MLRGGVGISTREDARAAGAEAAAAAAAAAGSVDAAFLFAGPGYGDELPLLLDSAVDALGTDRVVGASAHGVLGAGCEHEDARAVAVLACAGVDALPFLATDPHGEEAAACDEIAARLGSRPRAEDLVIVLPDPRTFDAGAFLPRLSEVLAPARIVGAGAGDPLAGEPLLWCGRSVASGGIAGMVLRGERPPRIGVTQACRPVTELFTVTRARGHWVEELDGRPALEVYREVARAPLAADLRRAASFLLVAVPLVTGDAALAPGSYLVRHVVGFETDANAFAIPFPARLGSRLALALREPESAREDLKDMLERMAGGEPAFGLYFDCCARGASFFGVPGLEAAYLERSLGAAPIAGMFGSCEIGPVGSSTELLTYTGVLALVDS